MFKFFSRSFLFDPSGGSKSCPELRGYRLWARTFAKLKAKKVVRSLIRISILSRFLKARISFQGYFDRASISSLIFIERGYFWKYDQWICFIESSICPWKRKYVVHLIIFGWWIFLLLMDIWLAGNQALLLCPQSSCLRRMHMFLGTSNLCGTHLI